MIMNTAEHLIVKKEARKQEAEADDVAPPTTTDETDATESNGAVDDEQLMNEAGSDLQDEACQCSRTDFQDLHPSPRTTRKIKKTKKRVPVLKAYLRSVLAIDHTKINVVPAIRTALIMVAEMCIVGVNNNLSTAFRLGALYVGMTEPNGSLTLRLRFMGLTVMTAVLFGALLPGLTWNFSAATLVTTFFVALATGLSLSFESPALYQAMKLGMALFAINGGVNRTTDGYGGLGYSVLWTFVGGATSLAASLLPEIIGNHEAIRCSLFDVWHGFGMSLRRWGKHWGTETHLRVEPIPTVTLSIEALKSMVSDDDTASTTKKWVLSIMDNADCIRVGSLCLSNVYKILRKDPCNKTDSDKRDEDFDAFFVSVGHACGHFALQLQFPWLVRYTPLLRERARRAIEAVDKAAISYDSAYYDQEEESGNDFICLLPSIVELVRSRVHAASELVFDGGSWPPYSSARSLPRRIAASFPSTWPRPNGNFSLAITSYALRLAITLTLATIPLVVMKGKANTNWFPMTVALLMGPRSASTYDKVAHRLIGTFFGLGLGAAMTPLYKFEPALIVLLGLNTYAIILFVATNYALGTFFITGWVFVTTVGTGAPLGLTTLYRCCWTLAAGALVIATIYTCPSKEKDDLAHTLAVMAKSVKSYAEAVTELSHLRRQCLRDNFENEANLVAFEAAQRKVTIVRDAAIKARVAMLTRINEASLTPSEGYRMDPYSLAPSLAGDLVDAVVIPQSVCLVTDGRVDGLLSDFDEETFSELDRLVKRLEAPEILTTSTRSTSITSTPAGRGPFSNAIASAHHRLDEACVPGPAPIEDADITLDSRGSTSCSPGV